MRADERDPRYVAVVAPSSGHSTWIDMEVPMRFAKLAPTPAVLWLIVCLGIGIFTASQAQAAENRFGLGAQFFKTIDDVADSIGDDSLADIEDEGYAIVASYQRIPRGLFRFEIDVEYYESGFGGSGEEAITPLAFVLVGRSLYVGVGVGLTFASDLDDNASDPFFAARIGYELDILPGLSIDLNANYRSGAFSDLDQFDTDAATLGAILRFNL